MKSHSYNDFKTTLYLVQAFASPWYTLYSWWLWSRNHALYWYFSTSATLRTIISTCVRAPICIGGRGYFLAFNWLLPFEIFIHYVSYYLLTFVFIIGAKFTVMLPIIQSPTASPSQSPAKRPDASPQVKQDSKTASPAKQTKKINSLGLFFRKVWLL